MPHTALLKTVPWAHLTHNKGNANDVPSLFHLIENGSESESRIAIAELSNLIEENNQLTSITPIVLALIANKLQDKLANRDLLLTILLQVAKAVASKWEEYRTTNALETIGPLADIWQEDSPYYVADFGKPTEDALIPSLADAVDLQLPIWAHTANVLLSSKAVLETLTDTTGIENGLLYEINTINKMIKPQERTIFAPSFRFETDVISLRPIHPEDAQNLTTHLQGNITKHLSFDPNGNSRIIAFYIDQSIYEQSIGNALVLVIEDAQTGAFLGSCALNDINSESVELGIWLIEEAQNKGYGKHTVEVLLTLIQEHIDTQYVLYGVEQDNTPSLSIPRLLGFEQTNTYILPPNALKNSFRTMLEFRKYLR